MDFASSSKGSWKQNKVERDFREVICGVPRTLHGYGGRLEQNKHVQQ